MLPMLRGFHFLRLLRYLTGADWGPDKNGEEQHRKRHTNCDRSVAKHHCLQYVMHI
jgi:hypothetical protein